MYIYYTSLKCFQRFFGCFEDSVSQMIQILFYATLVLHPVSLNDLFIHQSQSFFPVVMHFTSLHPTIINCLAYLNPSGDVIGTKSIVGGERGPIK